jgi:hypothetical protein
MGARCHIRHIRHRRTTEAVAVADARWAGNKRELKMASK